MKEYKGPLDPNKMKPEAKKAYEIWSQQVKRNTREYSSREFVAWWLQNIKKKKWKDPTCGRIDHSKGYSFDNIIMQERVDNIRERNTRLGNPGNRHRSVTSYTHQGRKLKTFKSKVEAAAYYKINVKTVYNHCMRRTKAFHNGPRSKAREVTFKWS